MNGKSDFKQEIRVRMGAKQTAKGQIQLDLTTEAPTVEKAGELLGQAIDKLVQEVKSHGFIMAGSKESSE